MVGSELRLSDWSGMCSLLSLARDASLSIKRRDSGAKSNLLGKGKEEGAPSDVSAGALWHLEAKEVF